MTKTPKLIIMERPRGFDTLNCTENDVWEIEKHENATNLRYGKRICYGRQETPGHNYDKYYKIQLQQQMED